MFELKRRKTHKRQGIALVTVLILIVMITTLVTVSTLLALGNRGASSDTVLTTQAQNLAEAGIEKALDTIFYETFRRWVINEANTGQRFDICAFKKWLTGDWSGSSQPNQKKIALNENNNPNCLYLGGTTLPNNLAANDTSGVIPTLLNNNTVVTLPTYTLLPGSTVVVTVKRVDEDADVLLTLESTSYIKNGTTELAGRKIGRTLRLSGSNYPGDEYAMLTNDINCSFCHLQVDSMVRAYADPVANPTATFPRVKLGALSPVTAFTFNNPANPNDTFIAGSFYVRGTGSTPPTALNTDAVKFAPWASTTEPGQVKPGANGTLLAPAATAYTGTIAAPTYDPAANINDALAINAKVAGAKPKGKLYYNYPDPDDASFPSPDGLLPKDFPSVVKDVNNDLLISDAEWTNQIATDPSGTLIPSGAIIYGVSRPSSVGIGGDILSSYDPISSNPLYLGTRVGDTLQVGNIWASGVAGKAAGAVMTAAMLQADLNVLTNMTRSYATPAAVPLTTVVPAGVIINGVPVPIGQLTIAEGDFANQWRGWLLQQALASPNNRDLRPTNGTADLNGIYTDSINAVGGLGGIAGFTPIVVPNGTAARVNNFWVAYNPLGNTINIAYCRRDPCITVQGGTAAFPGAVGGNVGTLSRNVSIIPGAGAATTSGATLENGTNSIAVLSIPFAAGDIFPAAKNSAEDSVSASGLNSGKAGYFDGNLIVDAGRIGDTGAAQKFATITGTVHVNGDMIIRGQIKGEGRFIVRGNIYIVGDLVYGCTGYACKITDGANPSYSKPDGLPKIALMAAGSIIVGDFDSPDGRASRSQFNLINDQIGQDRAPGPNAVPTPQPTPNAMRQPNYTASQWQAQNVPGSTGVNAIDAAITTRVQGFVHELAAIANDHGKAIFKSTPFGFMSYRSGKGVFSLGNYELPTSTFPAGAGQINAAASGSNRALCAGAVCPSIQTLYPSNGPMRIGGNALAGFAVQPIAGGAISNPLLSCVNNANQLTSIPTVWNAAAFQLNSGFWCPPSAGSFVRQWGVAAPALANPALDAAAWMAQPGQNAALDGNIGMTTGWIGGLLKTNQAVGNGFDQTGDLSQTRILKIMWLATMETTGDRDPNKTGVQPQGPLRTDGMLYSPNSVFCVARYRRDNGTGNVSSTQARWIHHGSLLSFELGFLLTGDVSPNAGTDTFTVNRTTIMDHAPAVAGTTSPTYNNYAPSMGVLYDERLRGLLGFNGGALEIRRTGVFSQVGR